MAQFIVAFHCMLAAWQVPLPYAKSMGHRGVYDEWKTVPFVDNQNKARSTFGQYGNLDSLNTTSKTLDEYVQYYKKYNDDKNRNVDSGNDSVTLNDSANDKKSLNNNDTDIVPVQGGLEDMNDGPRELWQKSKNKNGKKRNRDDKKKNRHHGKKSGKGASKKDGKKMVYASDETFLGSQDYDDPDILFSKYLGERPNFKKNMATITESVEKETVASTTITITIPSSTTNAVTKTTSGYFAVINESISEDANDDDDNDDADDKLEDPKLESHSHDASSEMIQHYDYYDENGDSSYSSSEQAAEAGMQNGKPFDWFKNYDKMHADQSFNDENYASKDEAMYQQITNKNDKKAKENIQPSEVNVTYVMNEEKDVSKISGDYILKTSLEPSISPNPPTSKTAIMLTVTQPAYPEWQEKVNTWNLIESKPAEACNESLDCLAGRMCKFGLCLCGQPDFCVGHKKPVCGSDGHLYPSHCELHRTACVLGVHIHIDYKELCMIQTDIDQSKNVDKLTNGKNEANNTIHKEMLNLERNSPGDTDIIPIFLKENISLENTEIAPSIEVVNQTTVKATDKVDEHKNQHIETELHENIDSISNNEINNDLQKTLRDPLVNNKSEATNGLEDITQDIDNGKLNNIVEDYLKHSEADTFDNDNYTLNSKIETVNGFEDNNSTLRDKTDRITGYSQNKDKNGDDDDNDDVVRDRIAQYKNEIEKNVERNATDVDDEAKSDVDKISSEGSSLVVQFCTPDIYMRFKADVLQYHCIYFEEPHCDTHTQEDKRKLAAVMFNYFDRDFSGYIEKEELWEMQMRERMDAISSLCSLLEIITFNEIGERNGKLSVDEFIQAFDIPDQLEHSVDVVPLVATAGNGLEVKCDVTDSTDVVWTRNDFDLSLLDFPGISVLGDGSLFLDAVGFHLVGNLTCYDRKKPSVIQIHMLTVQSSPHVLLSMKTHEWNHGNNIVLHCHAEGYPKPSITWLFEDEPIYQSVRYQVQGYDNTLIVKNAKYIKDTGIYKCRAQNTAGVGEASAAITVHSPNTSANAEVFEMEESFAIFHDDGYTLHEPSQCLTQRHVKPDFSNFYLTDDELDTPPSLCNLGEPCMWGEVVNVMDTFLYAAQPKQNRIVVIDLKYTFNPYQGIKTDHMPVSLHYIAYLDEVWIVCWNNEKDDDSKSLVIVRNASQKSWHYTIHTQPIGNMFELVQDLFLPPDSELHQPYKYGYTVHIGQQGLFKVKLDEKKYIQAVDLNKYDCIPKDLTFIPLGGHVLIKCEKTYGTQMELLTMDLITDTVVANITTNAVPYVSPDVSSVVFVDEQTGKISVHDITENGEIIHKFDMTVGSPVGMATFHKASYSHGYDFYLVSAGSPAIFAVNIETGKLDSIKDIGEFDSKLVPPWLKKIRQLVTGDIFSSYLATMAKSSFLILNSQHHNIQCDYKDIQNPSVVVFTHLNKLS